MIVRVLNDDGGEMLARAILSVKASGEQDLLAGGTVPSPLSCLRRRWPRCASGFFSDPVCRYDHKALL